METNQENYEKRVVFFLDILAFKNMINSSETKVADVKKFLDIIKDLENDQKYSPSLKVTTFSDSVIVSFEYTEGSRLFFELINFLHLQFELFGQRGVLMRGACAMGDAIHTDKYVFGRAVNNAYLLESKCALYPRIIISEDIIRECSCYSMHQNYNDQKDILKLLKQDTDGFYYIDYFSYDVVDSEMDYPEYWGLYMKNVQEFIIKGLKTQDISVKQKYLWLKDKYNRALTDILITNYQNHYSISLSKID